jgi:hypothetical protein
MITPNLEFAFSIRLDFPPGPRLRFPLRAGESRRRMTGSADPSSWAAEKNVPTIPSLITS